MIRVFDFFFNAMQPDSAFQPKVCIRFLPAPFQMYRLHPVAEFFPPVTQPAINPLASDLATRQDEDGDTYVKNRGSCLPWNKLSLLIQFWQSYLVNSATACSQQEHFNFASCNLTATSVGCHDNV